MSAYKMNKRDYIIRKSESAFETYCYICKHSKLKNNNYDCTGKICRSCSLGNKFEIASNIALVKRGYNPDKIRAEIRKLEAEK
jgi:hypothetical protein